MMTLTNFFEDDHKKHIESINNAERLYKEQLKKLKDCEEFVRMTRKNLVDKVRVERSTYDYINWNQTFQAFAELKITDKRKKTPILNFLSDKISEDFFASKVKIKVDELLYAGMNEYGIIVHFSINGRRYYIEIPLKDNITESDSELNYDIGKFCFAEEINETWYVQIYSYDIDDVKEYIAKNVIKNESVWEEKDDAEGID